MSFLAQAGAQIAGGFLSAYGKIASAQATKDEQEKINAVKEQQVNEILQREDINEAFAEKQGSIEIGAAVGGNVASSGGSTSGLAGQSLGLHNELTTQIAMMRRDAEFKVRMIRAGESIDSDIANIGMRGAYISAGASILGAAGTAGSTISSNLKTDDLAKTTSVDLSQDPGYSKFGGSYGFGGSGIRGVS